MEYVVTILGQCLKAQLHFVSLYYKPSVTEKYEVSKYV